MTDESAEPSTAAGPRRPADRHGPSAAQGRPAPRPPPGAAGVLTDRILLHTSWDTGKQVLDALPDEVGGLVLVGGKAGTGMRELRRRSFARPALWDPEGYRQAFATADDPFAIAQDGLFTLSLEETLQGQRDAGACAALTPTGYLRAGDRAAVRAAVRAADAVDRDDVLLSVPIAAGWLAGDLVGALISELSGTGLPKAILLGGQFDPLRRRGAVENLRRVIAEVGDVAVLRTDLTAFDAMSHGAFAASIGTSGSSRHVVPFGEPAFFGRSKDRSPSLLYGDLMSFHKGATLQTRFADARPPVCRCAACGERALDSFLGPADEPAARRHTVCTWASWISEMQSQPTLRDRAEWWRNRCRGAVAFADMVSTRLEQPEAFAPPGTLTDWAELPP